MNILNAFLLSSIAGLSTVVGGLFIFLPIKNHDKFICFALSFSLSIMIGISIFDLLPESVYSLYKVYKIFAFLLLIFLFLISYILIKFIYNKLSKYNDSLYKIGLLSMITLIIHNFPEGILTFLSSVYDIKLGLKMTFAIALHNIPEGIAISVPIYYATKSIKKALGKTLLSAIAEPIGAVVAYLFLAKYINNEMINIILIIVSGLMITLAIEKLFPKAKEFHDNKSLLLGLLTGLLITFITFIIQ